MSICRLARIIHCTLLLVTPVMANAVEDTATEQDASHRETVMHDLFAVITLNGLHCEQVVDYDLIKDMDYVAICKNGERYRIDVTPQGRVRVGPHQGD